MVDGVHVGKHCCVVALGIDVDGVKHPLSLVGGSTENATLVRELLVGLRERGLDVTRPILVVIDGAKALHRGVCDVFDHPVIARCQLHKRQKRRRPPAEKAALGRGQADARGLPRRDRPGRPGSTGEPGRRAGAPTQRGRLPARGTGGNPLRAAPGRATHPGPIVTQHQLRREHDRNRTGPLPQRQTLAQRAHGPALVRRRHGRSPRPVPPGHTVISTCGRCGQPSNGMSQPKTSAAQATMRP